MYFSAMITEQYSSVSSVYGLKIPPTPLKKGGLFPPFFSFSRDHALRSMYSVRLCLQRKPAMRQSLSDCIPIQSMGTSIQQGFQS